MFWHSRVETESRCFWKRAGRKLWCKKARVSCCDTVVHMFNMVAVLHCLWDTWSSPCHSVPSSWRQCRGLWGSLVAQQAGSIWLWCAGHHAYQICEVEAQTGRFEKIQIIAGVLNNVRSNRASSYQKRQPRWRNQWVCQQSRKCFAVTHDWQTQPLFGAARRASVTAEYQGETSSKSPPPPPPPRFHLLHGCQRELS